MGFQLKIDPEFNFIKFVFINLVFFMIVVAGMINCIEPYLPSLITQTFRYGKFSQKSSLSHLATSLEVPKSWFKHFYIFAGCWSTWIFWIAVNVYLRGSNPPTIIIALLNLLCGNNRPINTAPLATFVAIFLLFLQCLRRLYETCSIQIFSSSNKINLIHYLVGYFHYFGTFLIILSEAPGFDQHATKHTLISLRQISIVDITAVILVLYSWMKQYETNVLLANLRKNSKGQIITHKHLMPIGGYFNFVSSPHMLFEILIYIGLYMIIYKNTSAIFVLGWVIANQIQTAWLTHKWYKTTFPNYPNDRYAIIPKIL